MNNPKSALGSCVAPLLGALLLTGCGGTKVLSEPKPIRTAQPLAVTAESSVTATLEWVIVRDGPGTWARNADWDEYLLSLKNESDGPIQITEVIVVDSLHTRVASQSGRKHLVKASKKTARRYRKSGIKVKAGSGAGTMLATGAAVTVVGVAASYASAYASLASGTTAAGGAGAAVGGLLLLGPAIAVGGIVRGVNNGAVNSEIEKRQTVLPIEVAAGEAAVLDVFFPLAPSPVQVELVYTDDSGPQTLVIDTSTALHGLHLQAPRD